MAKSIIAILICESIFQKTVRFQSASSHENHGHAAIEFKDGEEAEFEQGKKYQIEFSEVEEVSDGTIEEVPAAKSRSVKKANPKVPVDTTGPDTKGAVTMGLTGGGLTSDEDLGKTS